MLTTNKNNRNHIMFFILQAEFLNKSISKSLQHISSYTTDTLAWLALLQTRPQTKFQWIIDVIQVTISLTAVHHKRWKKQTWRNAHFCKREAGGEHR